MDPGLFLLAPITQPLRSAAAANGRDTAVRLAERADAPGNAADAATIAMPPSESPTKAARPVPAVRPNDVAIPT